MDPEAVAALCHEHAQAEAELDIDRVLATLVPVPRYEFFPLSMSIVGWKNVERFYREQYPAFVPLVLGYEVLGEWTNEHAALQEYAIDVRRDGAGAVSHRVMSMMPVDEQSGLLSGERLYADDEFVRTLLGPLFEVLEPLTGP